TALARDSYTPVPPRPQPGIFERFRRLCRCVDAFIVRSCSLWKANTRELRRRGRSRSQLSEGLDRPLAHGREGYSRQTLTLLERTGDEHRASAKRRPA